MKGQFRSGFVGLAGRPNVGKSSLLNALTGEKIAITSDKPQTTRNQLRGILTGANYQVVWTDTPGLHRPFHALGSQMVDVAQKTLAGVDLVLWVLDASLGVTAADQKVAEILGKLHLPLVAA
jgi:GTP-binding protein Era